MNLSQTKETERILTGMFERAKQDALNKALVEYQVKNQAALKKDYELPPDVVEAVQTVKAAYKTISVANKVFKKRGYKQLSAFTDFERPIKEPKPYKAPDPLRDEYDKKCASILATCTNALENLRLTLWSGGSEDMKNAIEEAKAVIAGLSL